MALLLSVEADLFRWHQKISVGQLSLGGIILGEFKIKKAPSEFIIPEDSLEKFISVEEGVVEIKSEEYSEENQSELFFLREAFSELNEHISWGRKTATNIHEQGGILVGSVFNDSEKKCICGIVYHVIRSDKDGDATYIQFTHDNWIQMYREFEEKHSHEENGKLELRVIGWYHTHPNMPVSISGIDLSTHINFFPNDWQFSVILNPQNRKWSVYNGNECKNCNGTIYSDITVVESINSDESSEVIPENIETTSQNNDSTPSESSENSVTIESTDSFVIKRRSLPPTTPVAQNTNRHTPTTFSNQNLTRAGSIPITSRTKTTPYRGYSQEVKGIFYYFPYHDVGDPKSYVISYENVRRITNTLDCWGFAGEEKVAIAYSLYTGYNSICRNNNGVEYYRFESDDFYADHFIYSRNNTEYISTRRNDPVKPRYASLVVEFSNKLDDFPQLCKRYSAYDCVLWVNARNTKDFLFFRIKNNTATRATSSADFNIKKRQIAVESLAENVLLSGRDIFGKLLDSILINSYDDSCIKTEYDGVSNHSKPYRIQNRQIKELLEKINKYGRFSDPFSIVISYSSPATHYSDLVLPWLNKIVKLWFFSINDCEAGFKNLDNERTGSNYTRFAFIISNREISIEALKPKLIGHATAFCFNITTQSYKFYRLF